MSKPDLLYIMNPKCGWCQKADPVVEELRKKGYKITNLDVNDPDDAKRSSEVKGKFNVQCGTPLFIDANSGNSVCGFREIDVLEKWAKGEKIPAPPTRPQPPQGAPSSILDILSLHKFRLKIWQEAKESLSGRFYNDMNTWKEWKYNDIHEDCPINELPEYPSNEQIQEEANKILNFVQNRG